MSGSDTYHHCVGRIREKVNDVGHGGRTPATTLVVELVELLRGVSQGVGGSAVLDPVTLLQEQRT